MEEITVILLNLFIIFITAKLVGSLFARFNRPSIVGEVLVGILIGPYVLGWIGRPDSSLVHLFGGDAAAAGTAMTLVLDVMAQLGVILLLFFVGLETRVSDLMKVKGRAILVGLLGLIVPFALGFAFMWLTGKDSIESAFVATAIVSTSIGITARVLGDLGVVNSKEARIILGAAVVDDVLGLLLLAVVSSMSSGFVDPLELILTGAEVLAFVIFIILIGTRVVKRFSIHLEKIPVDNAPLVVTLTLMLGLSVLAGVIGLAAIIGAFLAGLMLSEARDHETIIQQARPIYDFFVPFFFVVTGTKVDLSAFLDPELLGLALAITLLAVLGKLIGSAVASIGLPPRSAAIIGMGMVPRGEVGLVVASIGIGIGAISRDAFSAIVFMSLTTTILAPPILVQLYRGYQTEEGDDEAPGNEAQIEPGAAPEKQPPSQPEHPLLHEG